MINQQISAIPDAGHRGIDARSLFVSKQEAFQDALTDVFVGQINTFRNEANALAGEVNQAQQSINTANNTATIQAGVATTKASEASTSANQALTYKNQVMGYVVPSGASYSVDQINTQNGAMTKAQFNALAEERKANRAGSGFDEYGKHTNNFVTLLPVNEGITSFALLPNAFIMGIKTAGIQGVSKTNYPIANVNGVLHRIDTVGRLETHFVNTIYLPPAPNIFPYDTVLTTEQINSGVIKHADASNSGLIANGKFDTDTSGWTAVGSGTTLSVVNNKLRITVANTNGSGVQSVSTVVGKKYIVELEYTKGTNSTASIQWGNTNALGTTIISLSNTSGRFTAEFTATATTTFIGAKVEGSGLYADFDNIAVYPADAISRSDLVFLESFHEDISEKNFVYPLGNTQYLGGNTDGLTGIANGTFSGFETYSLFGNFQAPSALIGKGYVWSNLTEAQKKAFISNPENNCYLDGDKVIQVRYRVRVVQGWGDSWASIDTQSATALLNVSGVYVAPRGKRVEVIDNGSGTQPITNSFYVPVRDSGNRHPSQLGLSTDNNGYWSIPSSIQVTGFAYEGKCFALPLALVQRKNLGMYHPTYNPSGSKKASDGNFWYNTAVSFTSISDCFDPSKLLTASGYIGTVSGRPDGLFYDQVHESDITDLRNSSKKVEDYNRLISREFNKLVAGTTRGSSKETKIQSLTQSRATTSGATYITIPTGYKVQEGTCIYHNSVASRVLYQSGQNVYITPTINILTNTPVLCSVEF